MLARSLKLYFIGSLALVFAGASDWCIERSHAPCDHLIELTVLATVSTFLISVCVRQMGRSREKHVRWYLLVCLLVAAGTLFADFRFVRAHRDACDARQGMQSAIPAVTNLDAVVSLVRLQDKNVFPVLGGHVENRPVERGED